MRYSSYSFSRVLDMGFNRDSNELWMRTKNGACSVFLIQEVSTSEKGAEKQIIACLDVANRAAEYQHVALWAVIACGRGKIYRGV